MFLKSVRLISLSSLLGLCFASTLFANQNSDAKSDEKLLTSFEEMAAFIQAESVPHKARSDLSMIEIPTKLSEKTGPLIIRWVQADGVVHFIHALPIQVSEESVSKIEKAVAYVNHGMPLPGFNINHKNNIMYYRLTVPLQPRGGIAGKEVRAYFSYAFKQANEFTPTFYAIAHEDLKPENAIEHYKKVRQLKQPKIVGSFQTEFGGSTWTLTIKGDGTSVLQRGDAVAVQSKFRLEKTRITFNDQAGPLACKDGTAIGSYDYAIDDEKGSVTFIKVEDECPGRMAVLTSAPWKRVTATNRK